ncbi:hypothetical protein D9M72_376000 [compost metagenome]
MQLDGLLRAEAQGIVGGHGCGGDVEADAGAIGHIARLPRLRRPIHRRARRLDQHHHLRAAVLDRLERGDGAPELDPFRCIGHGQVLALLGRAKLLRRQHQLAVPPGLGQAEGRRVRARQAGAGGHGQPVQPQRGLRPRAVQRIERRQHEARILCQCCRFQQEQRRRAVFETGRHQQPVGAGSIGHLGSAAAQYEAIRACLRADRDAVVLPAAIVRQHRGGTQLATGQPFQPLCAATRAQAGLQPGRCHAHGGPERHAGQALAQLFLQQHQPGRAQAGAAHGFGQCDAAPAEFARDRLPQRFVVRGTRFGHAPHRRRIAVRGEVVARAVADHLLFDAKGEVHGRRAQLP